MRRFVEGTDRAQSTLFPECLEDWICEDNPVRAIDVFVDQLDLAYGAGIFDNQRSQNRDSAQSRRGGQKASSTDEQTS
jgi:hypothetical protein